MAKRVKRKYGFPFTGYRADVSRDVVPVGGLTAESRDFVVSSNEGSIALRGGYQVLLATESSGTNLIGRTGLLGQKWRAGGLAFDQGGYGDIAVCRQLFPLRYPYTDTIGLLYGASRPTGLFTDTQEEYRYGALLGCPATQLTTQRSKVLGTDCVVSASAGSSYRIASSVEPLFKMIPIPAITRGGYISTPGAVSSGVTYNRCAFEYATRFLTPGAFRMVQAGGRALIPNLHGAPISWNCVMNVDGTNASERVRIGPWGNIPPMSRPTFSSDNYGQAADSTTIAGTAVASATGAFHVGDCRYLSVMFQYEDGSFSAPYMPLTNLGTLADVGSFEDAPILVSAAGGGSAYKIDGSERYSSLTYKNVPIGGPGVVRRIILGTDWINVGTKVISATWAPPGGNATSGNTVSMIDPANLKVVGIINNNTDTTFTDTTRDNNALRVDAQAIRFDGIFCPPSRYAFEMERRIGVGYSRRVNPLVAQFAPLARRSSAAPLFAGDAWRGLNLADDAAAAYNAKVQCLRLFRSTAGVVTLSLRQCDILTSANFTEQTQTNLETKTIGEVMLTLLHANALLLSGNPCTLNGGAWASGLLPGVDRNLLCSNLQPTVFQVASCTLTGTAGFATTTATAPYDFTDVGLGMKCRIVSGAGTAVMPAVAVVVGKPTNKSLVLGDVNGNAITTTAGGAGAAVLEFWSDTGDDLWYSGAASNATWGNGNMRAVCPALPVMLSLNGRYMDAVGIDKQRIAYTSAAPGQASMAAQSFFNNQANLKSVPSSAGAFMGSAALGSNNLLCYSRATYVLANRKGGSSGEDLDYHVYPLNLSRGCTHFGSIANGNGWALFRSLDGWVVTDGEREVLISGALHDPGTLNGIVNDFGTNYGDEKNAGDIQYQKGHACVSGGAIHITYPVRYGATVGAYVRSVYSFAPGLASSGLAQVLKNGTEPYPWSAPLLQEINAICAMPDGTLFGNHDKTGSTDVLAATEDGTLWKLETQMARYNSAGTLAQVVIDDGPSYSVVMDMNATANTATVSAADYKRIPIGGLITGANITGSLLVTGKVGDGVTLNVSGTFTDVSAATRTVYGQEVGYASAAYLCTDQLDSIENKKSLLRVALRMAVHTLSTLQVQFYNLLARSTTTTMLFNGTAISNGRHIPSNRHVKAPLLARSQGNSGEFVLSVLHPSMSLARHEVFGVDAEYDVSDSPR